MRYLVQTHKRIKRILNYWDKTQHVFGSCFRELAVILVSDVVFVLLFFQYLVTCISCKQLVILETNCLGLGFNSHNYVSASNTRSKLFGTWLQFTLCVMYKCNCKNLRWISYCVAVMALPPPPPPHTHTL